MARDLVGKILIGIGLLILVIQGALHFHAASRGALRPYNEDEKSLIVLFPFIGTMCLGGGIFMLALGGGRKNF